MPAEILTDNGSQYVTWRGKSQFSRELEKRGIRQIVARPRRPQTLGKIERFWGSLWRECLETSMFLDLADARQRIGLYIDYYNFQRPHQGIEGMVVADFWVGESRTIAVYGPGPCPPATACQARHHRVKPPLSMPATDLHAIAQKSRRTHHPAFVLSPTPEFSPARPIAPSPSPMSF